MVKNKNAEIIRLSVLLKRANKEPLPSFPPINNIPTNEQSGNKAASTASKLKFSPVNVSKLIP
jgi:hypothetical protein